MKTGKWIYKNWKEVSCRIKMANNSKQWRNLSNRFKNNSILKKMYYNISCPDGIVFPVTHSVKKLYSSIY